MKTATKVAIGIGAGLIALVGTHYISHKPVHQKVRVQKSNSINKSFQKKKKKTIDRIFNENIFEFELEFEDFDSKKRAPKEWKKFMEKYMQNITKIIKAEKKRDKFKLIDIDQKDKRINRIKKFKIKKRIFNRNKKSINSKKREFYRNNSAFNIMKRNRSLLYKKIIQKYFQKPKNQTHIYSQLRTIIAKQYEKNRVGEVGGAIFFKNHSLEFKIIKSPHTKNMKYAYQQFVQGNYQGAALLEKSAQEVYQLNKKHLPSTHLNMIRLETMINVFHITQQKRMGLIKDGLKRHVIKHYKALVLNGIFKNTYKHLGVYQPGFVGTFHVHKNGGTPSGGDVDQSKKDQFPYIVISPQNNFKNNRVKIYIVNNGSFSTLYEGFLKSRN